MTLARRALSAALIGLAVTATTDDAAAQRLPSAKSSPSASVTQNVGLTDVTVTYHRPAKRGRNIFGGLVSYGQLWRAGANENTTIEFSTDVLIEGKPLAAGTYGLHFIPTADRWTTIFSNNSTSWGSYSYTPDEDALRVDVTPEAMPVQEWMSFDFVPQANDITRLEMRWDTTRVPLEIGVDLTESILEQTRSVYLRGLNKWNPTAWQQAAQFCLDREVNFEEGASWAAEAARMQPTFTSMSLHAQLLDKAGRGDEAASVKQKAWSVATEKEFSDFAGQLIAARRYDDAVALLEMNAKNHPESWRAHDRLGEAYHKAGVKDKALNAYMRAIDLVRDDTERDRLEKAWEAVSAG